MSANEEGEKKYADLKTRFTYHPPTGDQAQRYEDLRRNAYSMAGLIEALCPDSREKSLALTKLEEAVMWANASIARNEVVERFTHQMDEYKGAVG